MAWCRHGPACASLDDPKQEFPTTADQCYSYARHTHTGNKMEDTLTLARQERKKQGPWEAEVSYGGEVDLHRHLASCDKNPGHQKFIPVDQFNVDHLPPGCPDNKLVDLVRVMSDLTVRVSVKYVSDSRPETVPVSDEPFPCYKDRGKDMMRTGTGRVWRVDKQLYNCDYSDTCKCKECVNTPTPKTQFARIYIHTAAHIVYDDLEAAHTTCHIFFDKGVKPDARNGVVTLSGVSLISCELDKDRCQLCYVTHDLYLAERLDKMVASYKHISESVLSIKTLPESLLAYAKGIIFGAVDLLMPRLNKNPQSQPLSVNDLPSCMVNQAGTVQTRKDFYVSEGQPVHDTWDTLSIIVSHPHGCSKQVSVGNYTDLQGRKDGSAKLTYTVPTCPGSSGAHVFVARQGWLGVITDSIHCGGHGVRGQQLNYSIY